ncbi:MAG: hypothetical protein GY850_33245, partial [bacterium]|nr:hypothetical protein [bacterium]
LSIAGSISLGLATVILGWSGIALPFGGIDVYISVYPPLLICLWWTISFGWLWGAIPAYLATFTLALYAGMPTGWAMLFGIANPLGFGAVAIAYRVIPMQRDLRSLPSLLFYVQITFFGAVLSSAGALVWCYTNRIDTTGMLPIWQGWWLGGFLQSIFIVGPILYLTSPAIARWRAQRGILGSHRNEDARRRILQLILVVIIGVLGYGFLTIKLGTDLVASVPPTANVSALMDAARVLSSTVWVFFWVFVIITVFIGFFYYSFFTRWEESTNAFMVKIDEKNKALIQEKDKLQEALAEVKTLGGLLPICASCKKIRDDKGYWNNLEAYIEKHSDVSFSHGICTECSDRLYGKEDWYIKRKNNKKTK